MPDDDAPPPLPAREARKLPVNCPRCGRPLKYVRTDRHANIYRCPRDGQWRFTEGGLHSESP